MKRGALIATAAATAAFAGGSAWAAVGQPVDGGIDLQPAATSIAHQIHDFHGFLLSIIVAISLLVLALLLWVIVRYNRRANATPRKFTHNILVEVIWTVLPVLILVAIAWKSFPLLYLQERVPPAELTLKVTGNSWFWNYEYPDLGVTIASNLMPEEDARAQGRPYLLATTEPLVVPVNTNVRILVTSNDVIHSFAMPAFGIKEDAIQGRVNDAWFNVERPGTYYGQCSELCGINHAYMPIEIRAVSREEFNAWVLAQGGSFASAEQPAAGATTPTESPAPTGEAPAAPATQQEPAAPAATPTR